MLFALPLCFLAVSTPVRAADEPSLPEAPADLKLDRRRLGEVDREIILEMIKLGRFNIRFHQAANQRAVWRTWFYPIAIESGTSLSYTNTLTDLSQRARGLEDLDKISARSRMQGLRCNIIGQPISGCASASELFQNLIVAYRAKRQGFSPKDSENFIKNGLSTIDQLLAKRQQIVSVTQDGRILKKYELEGRILEQVRNQLVLEFERWSAQSRELMWRQNTFFFIDSLGRFTAMSGSICSLKGFTTPWLRGPAAILSLTAPSIATVNPLIKISVGVCMRKYQRWHLSRVFQNTRSEPVKDLLAEWKELDQLSSSGDPDSDDTMQVKRESFIAEYAERTDQVLDKEQERIEKLRQVAAQQAISGPMIGMAGVARSVLNTIAFYGNTRRGSFISANSLNFAGRISQALGQTYNLINTPVTRINKSIYSRKLEKEGKSPSQFLEARLHRLDELEKEIRSYPLTQ